MYKRFSSTLQNKEYSMNYIFKRIVAISKSLECILNSVLNGKCKYRVTATYFSEIEWLMVIRHGGSCALVCMAQYFLSVSSNKQTTCSFLYKFILL